MSATAFSTVCCTRWQTSVTFSANHFFAVVLGCKCFERGFNDPTAKTTKLVHPKSKEMGLHTARRGEEWILSECCSLRVYDLMLVFLCGRRGTIFELFPGKDETLLVWWDSFFILDFGFDVVDRVRGLDFKGNSLTSQSLDKDLH